ILEKRVVGPATLLRVGGERRDRLLRRGDDAAELLVRLQPAYARDYLQFHAAARAPGGSGCKTGAWPILVRRSSQVSRTKSSDGRANRAPGSDRVFHRPRPGADVSNRQASDHAVTRRSPFERGREV